MRLLLRMRVGLEAAHLLPQPLPHRLPLLLLPKVPSLQHLLRQPP